MTEEERLERRRAQNRASYQRNREKILAKHREWRRINPEKMREANAAWYHKNHEKALSARAAYRESHRGELRALIRLWYYRNKQRVLDAARLQRTGCTPERYAELFRLQQGLCAICKLASDRTLHADHCHKENVMRGLLCGKCNRALGLFGDSVERLKDAIRYLET